MDPHGYYATITKQHNNYLLGPYQPYTYDATLHDYQTTSETQNAVAIPNSDALSSPNLATSNSNATVAASPTTSSKMTNSIQKTDEYSTYNSALDSLYLSTAMTGLDNSNATSHPVLDYGSVYSASKIFDTSSTNLSNTNSTTNLNSSTAGYQSNINLTTSTEADYNSHVYNKNMGQYYLPTPAVTPTTTASTRTLHSTESINTNISCHNKTMDNMHQTKVLNSYENRNSMKTAASKSTNNAYANYQQIASSFKEPDIPSNNAYGKLNASQTYPNYAAHGSRHQSSYDDACGSTSSISSIRGISGQSQSLYLCPPNPKPSDIYTDPTRYATNRNYYMNNAMAAPHYLPTNSYLGSYSHSMNVRTQNMHPSRTILPSAYPTQMDDTTNNYYNNMLHRPTPSGAYPRNQVPTFQNAYNYGRQNHVGMPKISSQKHDTGDMMLTNSSMSFTDDSYDRHLYHRTTANTLYNTETPDQYNDYQYAPPSYATTQYPPKTSPKVLYNSYNASGVTGSTGYNNSQTLTTPVAPQAVIQPIPSHPIVQHHSVQFGQQTQQYMHTHHQQQQPHVMPTTLISNDYSRYPVKSSGHTMYGNSNKDYNHYATGSVQSVYAPSTTQNSIQPTKVIQTLSDTTIKPANQCFTSRTDSITNDKYGFVDLEEQITGSKILKSSRETSSFIHEPVDVPTSTTLNMEKASKRHYAPSVSHNTVIVSGYNTCADLHYEKDQYIYNYNVYNNNYQQQIPTYPHLQQRETTAESLKNQSLRDFLSSWNDDEDEEAAAAAAASGDSHSKRSSKHQQYTSASTASTIPVVTAAGAVGMPKSNSVDEIFRTNESQSLQSMPQCNTASGVIHPQAVVYPTKQSSDNRSESVPNPVAVATVTPKIHVGITVDSMGNNLPDIIIDIEKPKVVGEGEQITATTTTTTTTVQTTSQLPTIVVSEAGSVPINVVVPNQQTSEKLYVLEAIDVPLSDLNKYTHLSVVNKLPENIVQMDESPNTDEVAESLKFIEDVETNPTRFDFEMNVDYSDDGKITFDARDLVECRNLTAVKNAKKLMRKYRKQKRLQKLDDSPSMSPEAILKSVESMDTIYTSSPLSTPPNNCNIDQQSNSIFSFNTNNYFMNNTKAVASLPVDLSLKLLTNPSIAQPSLTATNAIIEKPNPFKMNIIETINISSDDNYSCDERTDRVKHLRRFRHSGPCIKGSNLLLSRLRNNVKLDETDDTVNSEVKSLQEICIHIINTEEFRKFFKTTESQRLKEKNETTLSVQSTIETIPAGEHPRRELTADELSHLFTANGILSADHSPENVLLEDNLKETILPVENLLLSSLDSEKVSEAVSMETIANENIPSTEQSDSIILPKDSQVESNLEIIESTKAVENIPNTETSQIICFDEDDDIPHSYGILTEPTVPSSYVEMDPSLLHEQSHVTEHNLVSPLSPIREYGEVESSSQHEPMEIPLDAIFVNENPLPHYQYLGKSLKEFAKDAVRLNQCQFSLNVRKLRENGITLPECSYSEQTDDVRYRVRSLKDLAREVANTIYSFNVKPLQELCKLVIDRYNRLYLINQREHDTFNPPIDYHCVTEIESDVDECNFPTNDVRPSYQHNTEMEHSATMPNIVTEQIYEQIPLTNVPCLRTLSESIVQAYDLYQKVKTLKELSSFAICDAPNNDAIAIDMERDSVDISQISVNQKECEIISNEINAEANMPRSDIKTMVEAEPTVKDSSSKTESHDPVIVIGSGKSDASSDSDGSYDGSESDSANESHKKASVIVDIKTIVEPPLEKSASKVPESEGSDSSDSDSDNETIESSSSSDQSSDDKGGNPRSSPIPDSDQGLKLKIKLNGNQLIIDNSQQQQPQAVRPNESTRRVMPKRNAKKYSYSSNSESELESANAKRDRVRNSPNDKCKGSPVDVLPEKAHYSTENDDVKFVGKGLQPTITDFGVKNEALIKKLTEEHNTNNSKVVTFKSMPKLSSPPSSPQPQKLPNVSKQDNDQISLSPTGDGCLKKVSKSPKPVSLPNPFTQSKISNSMKSQSPPKRTANGKRSAEKFVEKPKVTEKKKGVEPAKQPDSIKAKRATKRRKTIESFDREIYNESEEECVKKTEKVVPPLKFSDLKRRAERRFSIQTRSETRREEMLRIACQSEKSEKTNNKKNISQTHLATNETKQRNSKSGESTRTKSVDRKKIHKESVSNVKSNEIPKMPNIGQPIVYLEKYVAPPSTKKTTSEEDISARNQPQSIQPSQPIYESNTNENIDPSLEQVDVDKLLQMIVRDENRIIINDKNELSINGSVEVGNAIVSNDAESIIIAEMQPLDTVYQNVMNDKNYEIDNIEYPVVCIVDKNQAAALSQAKVWATEDSDEAHSIILCYEPEETNETSENAAVNDQSQSNFECLVSDSHLGYDNHNDRFVANIIDANQEAILALNNEQQYNNFSLSDSNELSQECSTSATTINVTTPIFIDSETGNCFNFIDDNNGVVNETNPSVDADENAYYYFYPNSEVTVPGMVEAIQHEEIVDSNCDNNVMIKVVSFKNYLQSKYIQTPNYFKMLIINRLLKKYLRYQRLRVKRWRRVKHRKTTMLKQIKQMKMTKKLMLKSITKSKRKINKTNENTKNKSSNAKTIAKLTSPKPKSVEKTDKIEKAKKSRFNRFDSNLKTYSKVKTVQVSKHSSSNAKSPKKVSMNTKVKVNEDKNSSWTTTTAVVPRSCRKSEHVEQVEKNESPSKELKSKSKATNKIVTIEKTIKITRSNVAKNPVETQPTLPKPKPNMSTRLTSRAKSICIENLSVHHNPVECVSPATIKPKPVNSRFSTRSKSICFDKDHALVNTAIPTKTYSNSKLNNNRKSNANAKQNRSPPPEPARPVVSARIATRSTPIYYENPKSDLNMTQIVKPLQSSPPPLPTPLMPNTNKSPSNDYNKPVSNRLANRAKSICYEKSNTFMPPIDPPIEPPRPPINPPLAPQKTRLRNSRFSSRAKSICYDRPNTMVNQHYSQSSRTFGRTQPFAGFEPFTYPTVNHRIVQSNCMQDRLSLPQTVHSIQSSRQLMQPPLTYSVQNHQSQMNLDISCQPSVKLEAMPILPSKRHDHFKLFNNKASGSRELLPNAAKDCETTLNNIFINIRSKKSSLKRKRPIDMSEDYEDNYRYDEDDDISRMLSSYVNRKISRNEDFSHFVERDNNNTIKCNNQLIELPQLPQPSCSRNTSSIPTATPSSSKGLIDVEILEDDAEIVELYKRTNRRQRRILSHFANNLKKKKLNFEEILIDINKFYDNPSKNSSSSTKKPRRTSLRKRPCSSASVSSSSSSDSSSSSCSSTSTSSSSSSGTSESSESTSSSSSSDASGNSSDCTPTIEKIKRNALLCRVILERHILQENTIYNVRTMRENNCQLLVSDAPRIIPYVKLHRDHFIDRLGEKYRQKNLSENVKNYLLIILGQPSSRLETKQLEIENE